MICDPQLCTDNYFTSLRISVVVSFLCVLLLLFVLAKFLPAGSSVQDVACLEWFGIRTS